MWYVATIFGVIKATGFNLEDLKFKCPNSLRNAVRIHKGYGPIPSIGSRFNSNTYRFEVKDSGFAVKRRGISGD